MTQMLPIRLSHDNKLTVT